MSDHPASYSLRGSARKWVSPLLRFGVVSLCAPFVSLLIISSCCIPNMRRVGAPGGCWASCLLSAFWPDSWGLLLVSSRCVSFPSGWWWDRWFAPCCVVPVLLWCWRVCLAGVWFSSRLPRSSLLCCCAWDQSVVFNTKVERTKSYVLPIVSKELKRQKKCGHTVNK